jgi:hypothetical protein
MSSDIQIRLLALTWRQQSSVLCSCWQWWRCVGAPWQPPTPPPGVHLPCVECLQELLLDVSEAKAQASTACSGLTLEELQVGPGGQGRPKLPGGAAATHPCPVVARRGATRLQPAAPAPAPAGSAGGAAPPACGGAQGGRGCAHGETARGTAAQQPHGARAGARRQTLSPTTRTCAVCQRWWLCSLPPTLPMPAALYRSLAVALQCA